MSFTRLLEFSSTANAQTPQLYLGILSANWLAKWNDFRQANWSELIEYPEFLLKQTQQLLELSA